MQDPDEKEGDFLKVNRFEVEDNAVFIDFQPEELMRLIDSYSEQNSYVRLSLAKNIPSVLRTVEKAETTKKFISHLVTVKRIRHMITVKFKLNLWLFTGKQSAAKWESQTSALFLSSPSNS